MRKDITIEHLLKGGEKLNKFIKLIMELSIKVKMINQNYFYFGLRNVIEKC